MINFGEIWVATNLSLQFWNQFNALWRPVWTTLYNRKPAKETPIKPVDVALDV